MENKIYLFRGSESYLCGSGRRSCTYMGYVFAKDEEEARSKIKMDTGLEDDEFYVEERNCIILEEEVN